MNGEFMKLIGRICGQPDFFGGRLKFNFLTNYNGHDRVIKCLLKSDADFAHCDLLTLNVDLFFNGKSLIGEIKDWRAHGTKN
jgi:hypothetical protein